MAQNFSATTVPTKVHSSWKRTWKQRHSTQQAGRISDALTITSVNPLMLKGNGYTLKPSSRHAEHEAKLPKQFNLNAAHQPDSKSTDLEVHDSVSPNDLDHARILPNQTIFKPSNQTVFESCSQKLATSSTQDKAETSFQLNQFSLRQSGEAQLCIPDKPLPRFANVAESRMCYQSFPSSQSPRQVIATHASHVPATTISTTRTQNLAYNHVPMKLDSAGVKVLSIHRVARLAQRVQKSREEIQALRGNSTVTNYQHGMTGLEIQNFKMKRIAGKAAARKWPTSTYSMPTPHKHPARQITIQGNGLCQEKQEMKQEENAECLKADKATTSATATNPVGDESDLVNAKITRLVQGQPKETNSILAKCVDLERHWVNPADSEELTLQNHNSASDTKTGAATPVGSDCPEVTALNTKDVTKLGVETKTMAVKPTDTKNIPEVCSNTNEIVSFKDTDRVQDTLNIQNTISRPSNSQVISTKPTDAESRPGTSMANTNVAANLSAKGASKNNVDIKCVTEKPFHHKSISVDSVNTRNLTASFTNTENLSVNAADTTASFGDSKAMSASLDNINNASLQTKCVHDKSTPSNAIADESVLKHSADADNTSTCSVDTRDKVTSTTGTENVEANNLNHESIPANHVDTNDASETPTNTRTPQNPADIGNIPERHADSNSIPANHLQVKSTPTDHLGTKDLPTDRQDHKPTAAKVEDKTSKAEPEETSSTPAYPLTTKNAQETARDTENSPAEFEHSTGNIPPDHRDVEQGTSAQPSAEKCILVNSANSSKSPAEDTENTDTERNDENSDSVNHLFETKEKSMFRDQFGTSKSKPERPSCTLTLSVKPKLLKENKSKAVNMGNSQNGNYETQCQSSVRKAYSVYSQKLKRSSNRGKTEAQVKPKSQVKEKSVPSSWRVQSAQAHVFRTVARVSRGLQQPRSKSVMDMANSKDPASSGIQNRGLTPESEDNRNLDEQQLRWFASLWSQCVAKNTLDKMVHVMKRLSFTQRQQLTEVMPCAHPMLFICCQMGNVQMVDYLLDECGADIEKEGHSYDESSDTVCSSSPLWCAAAAGHVEVLRSLLKHGANIHYKNSKGSTAMHSACSMKHIKVVKILLEAGADLHAKCNSGSTCLINSFHCSELVRLLLRNGARPNEQDCLGNAALHYAAREGYVGSLATLIQFGGECRHRNHYGNTVLMCAALKGLDYTVNYITNNTHFFKFAEVIEAYELLGCGLVDEHGAYYAGIEQWRKALMLRNKTFPKANLRQERIPAFNNKLEMTTLAELDSLAANPYEARMQSLLIRERICGHANKEVVSAMMSSGSYYLRELLYRPCIELWKYALRVSINTLHPLDRDLQYMVNVVVRLFLRMCTVKEMGFEDLHISDTLDTLSLIVKHLAAAKQALKEHQSRDKPDNCDCAGCTSAAGMMNRHSFRCTCNHHGKGAEETYLRTVVLALHLVRIMATYQDFPPDKLHSFHCLVYRLVKADHRTDKGDSLLHLCFPLCRLEENEDDHRVPTIPLLETLLTCGADADAVNCLGESPLFHILTCNQLESRASDILLNHPDTDGWIRLLLKHGAHVDRVSQERTDLLFFLKDCDYFCPLNHINLQCLAARAIRDYGVPYDDPTTLTADLIRFVSFH